MNSKQFTIHGLSGREAPGFLPVPENCVLCGSRLLPYPVALSDSNDKVKINFETVYQGYQCTGTCSRLNIAVYKLRAELGNTTNYELENLLVTVPRELPAKEISPEIESLSPKFASIYKQALIAETMNLSQLTGLGFRKALEFLVKDYAILHYPEDAETIKKKPVAMCINEYMKEDYLRECARRAAWLGNDETHYSREWQNHDIQDLKKLLLLTLRWLEYALLSEKYFREMPSKT